MDCSLSSSTDVTLWKYKPFGGDDESRYLLGIDEYEKNICFPGPSPLYSIFSMYPDNILYGLIVSFDELFY